MDEYDALERHQELVHELAAGRQLNTFDSAAVDAVAALVVRREQCQLILAAEGPTAARESGEPIEHPAAKVERQASSDFLHAAQKFRHAGQTTAFSLFNFAV